MTVKLLTDHHLEFLNLRGGCTGSSESTPVKMSHCWKSHVTAHFCVLIFFSLLEMTQRTVELSWNPGVECWNPERRNQSLYTL